MHTCNPNTWGAEAGSQEAGGQPGIDDIFSQKKRKNCLKTLTALGWRDVVPGTKVFAAKPGGLSLFPGTHTVEAEKQLVQVVL